MGLQPVLPVDQRLEAAQGRPDRLWALHRVRSGDYLLPSNELDVLWRVSTFDEDGSAFWIDQRQVRHHIVGRFWRLRRLEIDCRRLLLAEVDDPDLLLEGWRDAGDVRYPTRRAAVEAALGGRV